VNHPDDRIANGGELTSVQLANLPGHKTRVGGEKLSGTRVTRNSQRPACEVATVHLNCAGIAVGFAGDLAKNPIATTRLGEHYRRTQLGRSEIGKWKVN
jgi:hypothetical protein